MHINFFKNTILLLGVTILYLTNESNSQTTNFKNTDPIILGAQQTERYLPILKNKNIGLLEKMIFILGAIVSILMLYNAINLYFKGEESFAIIFGVFGGIFLFTTIKDVFKYVLNKPLEKQTYGKLDWYFEHFKRMCISFIAAVTAFVSIQDVFKNNTANFLIPTLIGTILIIIATKFYKKKLLK